MDNNLESQTFEELHQFTTNEIIQTEFGKAVGDRQGV
jgi:hypothetical protein